MTEQKNIVDMVQEIEKSDAPEEKKVVSTDNILNVPVDEKSDVIVAQLLGNLEGLQQWVTVELPSQGSLYSNFEGNSVEIRPITYADEKKIRAAMKAGNTNVMDLMLDSCMKPLPVSVLTLPDKMYLMYKVREFSYGSSYPFSDSCRSCGTKNELVLELSGLGVNFLEKSYNEYCNIELPDSKCTVQIKPLRSGDLERLGESKSKLDDLMEYIVSINDITDSVVISKFLDRTTIRDVSHIRERLFSQDYGMNQTSNYFCDECGVKNTVPLGFNESFFIAS